MLTLCGNHRVHEEEVLISLHFSPELQVLMNTRQLHCYLLELNMSNLPEPQHLKKGVLAAHHPKVNPQSHPLCLLGGCSGLGILQ